MNLNDSVIVGASKVAVTFGNFMSAVVKVIREDFKSDTGATFSWEVCGYHALNGDNIRKRAGRVSEDLIKAVRKELSVCRGDNKVHRVFEINFKIDTGSTYKLALQTNVGYNQILYIDAVYVPESTKPTQTSKQEKAEPAKYMMLPDSVVVIHDGKPVIVGKDHINFKVIKDQLAKDGTYDPKMLEPVRVIEQFAHAGLTYKDGKVQLDGSNFKYQMFDKLVDAIKSDNTEDNLKKLFAFVRRAIENTSNQITERILDFAKCSSIDFTDDGMMICFKKVTSDYKDVYTKKIDNSVGKTVQVPRSQVDENMDKTCSYGLHTCSKNYLKHYPGQKILKVLVDPADVVAIPRDYSDSKLRCCKYHVVEDVTEQMKEHI